MLNDICKSSDPQIAKGQWQEMEQVYAKYLPGLSFLKDDRLSV